MKKIDKRRRYRLQHGYVSPTPMYAHQAVGVCDLEAHTHRGLLDDPGLGKTLQVLYAAMDLLKAGEIDCAVVVCKRGVIPVWLQEIAKHVGTVPVSVVSGRPPADRPSAWRADALFYLANYELLSRKGKHALPSFRYRPKVMASDDARDLSVLLRSRRCLLVLDEAAKIKSPRARVARVLAGLAPLAARRQIVTGKLVPERPQDVWSQAYFVDMGKTLGQSYAAFLRRYVVMAEAANGRRFPVGYRNLEELRALLPRFSIRRLKRDCLDLPPKTYTRRWSIQTAAERRLLVSILKELRDELEALSENRVALRDTAVSRLMHSAQRAAAFPSLEDSSVGGIGKFDALLEILDEEPGQVLVWCVHRDVAERAGHLLARHGVEARVLHGGVDPDERAACVGRFQEGAWRVLVATMGSLKEAHTLTNVTRAVYLQRGFSLNDWIQSTNRIHRIGQTGTVLIETILARPSLDAYEALILGAKEVVTDFVSGDSDDDRTVTRRSLLKYLEAELAEEDAHGRFGERAAEGASDDHVDGEEARAGIAGAS